MIDPVDPPEDEPIPIEKARRKKGADGPGGPEVSKADDRLADFLDRPWPKGFSDRFRFDHERDQWHIRPEKGSIWAPDTTGEVFELLRDRLMTRWLPAQTSAASITALASLLNLPKKKSVLESFSYRRSVALEGSEWDQDPYLVGAPNGIIDLRDGRLIAEPHPEWLISRSVAVPYDPNSDAARDCPQFLNFLGQITANDTDKAGYLLRLFGYALFGLQTEQKFWLFTGIGQNGKGTLTRVMAHIFGDYAMAPSAALYMRSKNGSPPSSAARADLIALHGIRLAPMSEPEGGAFNDELIKAHTGEDPIRARALYKAEIEFRPTHTIIVATNHPPRVEDVGKSMQRRVRVVPFTEVFDGARRDLRLEDKLKTESVGILALLVRYAGLWWDEQDLAEPASVTSASAAYIEENDLLSEFVYDRCVVSGQASVAARALYDAYSDWSARSENARPMTQTEFGTAISRRFQKRRSAAGQHYFGLRLKTAFEQVDQETAD